MRNVSLVQALFLFLPSASLAVCLCPDGGFDPHRCTTFSVENASMCRPLADKGDPDAQRWLAEYHKNKLTESLSDFFRWQDARHNGEGPPDEDVWNGLDEWREARRNSGDPPDENARKALKWYEDAAHNYLRTGRPYEAALIVKTLRDTSDFSPLSYDRLTLKIADRLARELSEIQVDRQAALAQLKATKDKAVQMALLRQILLPVSPASPIPADVTYHRISSVSTIQQAPSTTLTAISFAGGWFMFCGTGIDDGGVQSPYGTSKGIRLALFADAKGIPVAECHKSRNTVQIIDADGDGMKNELVVSRDFFDFGQPPYLIIYDLARPKFPVMLAITFNRGYELPRGWGTARKPRKGRWWFRMDAESHRNDVIVLEEHSDAPKTEVRFQYDTEARNWTLPRETSSGFWAPGLRGQMEEPFRRLGITSTANEGDGQKAKEHLSDEPIPGLPG